jgi:hypothetical protein
MQRISFIYALERLSFLRLVYLNIVIPSAAVGSEESAFSRLQETAESSLRSE